MTTVFERIDTAMAGGDLPVNLATETNHLSGAGALLDALTGSPPTSIDDLRSGLAGVSLPGVDVATDLLGVLASLQDALPDDLESITQGLVNVSGSLTVNVSGRLIAEVNKLVRGVTAIAALVEQANSIVPAGRSEPPPAPGGPPPGGEPPAVQRRAARAEALNRVNDALDTIPEPFEASNAVTFAHDALSAVPRAIVQVPYVPILDDLLYLTSTTIALREADAATLETHIRAAASDLSAFLAGAGVVQVDAVVSALQAVTGTLDGAGLRSSISTLTQGLRNIAEAAGAGDVSGLDLGPVNAAADQAFTQLAVLSGDGFAAAATDAESGLGRLVSDMDAGLRRVAHATLPPDYLSLVGGAGQALRDAVDEAEFDELAEDIRQAFEPILEALDQIDVPNIFESVRDVVEGINEAIAQFDGLLSGVVSQVTSLFDELDGLIDEVDLSAVTDAVTEALAQFTNELRQRVDELFAPMRTEISSAVGEISGALSSFDPDNITSSLNDAIAGLRSVLESPEVADAIATVKGAIEGAADGLRSLTFTPVTDQVVGAIDEITGALNALDPAVLSPPAKIALGAAKALLPSDLDPLFDEIDGEFSVLVDEGPKPLLEQVRDKPARLLEQVQRFAPKNLVGTELSAPYNDLIDRLDAVQPTDLLAPVNSALEDLKGDLRDAADPTELVAPLRAPYQELIAALDSLDPQRLVAPIEAALEDAADALENALPLDDFFAVFDDFMARINDVVGSARGIKRMLAKLTGVVEDLSDPEASLRAWLRPAIDRVDDIADLSAIQARFDEISDALDRLGRDELRSRLEAALEPLGGELDELEPAALLQDIATAHRSVRRAEVDALPDSAEKTAVLALLDRFDPASASFARPFQRLDELGSSLVAFAGEWDGFLDGWATRTQSPGGPLDGLRQAGLTKQKVKELLEKGFEDELIKPIAAVLSLVGDTARDVAGPLQAIRHFVDQLDEKATSILAGPQALTDLRDALDGVVQRIRDLDVGFVARELQEVFDAVKGKLQPLSPDALAAVLETAFDDALGLLDISALLPQDDLQELDTSYQEFVDDLRELDPVKIVVEATQPVFDEDIVPLIEAFDITVVIEALIETLDALKAQLGGELDRVNDSYKRMRDALPELSPLDIDIDVSVDIGF